MLHADVSLVLIKTFSSESSLLLGDKPIMFVTETKVLGVIIDKDLTYKSHSKMIHKRLCHRWVTVCKHSNRNWGFSQRVMVQLIKTIFQSTLLYASHIWMNKMNMTDINVFWYKLLKSSVGAVLNVRQSLAGLILGLPPIEIVNRVTLIKHYLTQKTGSLRTYKSVSLTGQYHPPSAMD